MFVRYYIFLDHPLEGVEERLLGSRARIKEIAREVSHIPKSVQMTFREPLGIGTEHVSLPFVWRAEGTRSVFPIFEGDIEMSRCQPQQTQLAVSARYEPPLGPVGRVLDKAGLHLLAEVLVKDLVDRVALDIDGALAAPTKATA